MASSQTEPPTQTPTWQQRTEALTHMLLHPTHAPSLHSQLFVASRIPCPGRACSYPPFLSAGHRTRLSLLRWAFTAVFLPRLSRLCLPPASWRSTCAFQLPPPAVLSAAVPPAPERWGEEERQEFLRRRREERRRRRNRFRVPQVLLLVGPNLALLALLVRDPLFLRPRSG